MINGELVIDNFAGGGGASTGIEMAIGISVDIGLRMLEPKELYGCQGFPDDYIIDRDCTGKPYPRSEQVRRCGNAVCPPIPAALVRANLPELCIAERTPNMKIGEEQSGQLSLFGKEESK